MNPIDRSAGKELSREEFAELAAEVMRECGWSGFSFDPAHFAMHSPDNVITYLENIYQQFLKASHIDSRALLTRFFTAMREKYVPGTFAEARENLLPVLLPRNQHMQFGRHVHSSEEKWLAQPFSEDLALCIVYDRPTSFSYVSPRNIEEWNTAAEDVTITSVHNLRLRSSDSWKPLAAGVFLSDWRDGFDASRMIFPDVMSSVPGIVNPVVLVPNRDAILLTSEENLAGIQLMARIGMALYDHDPKRLSARPFVLRDGSWVAYEISEPAAFEVLKRTTAAMNAAYDLQKPMLEKIVPENVFVASVFTNSSERTREVETNAVWSKGITTLLPRTDVINFFISKEDGFFQVRWDDAERILGAFPQEAGVWPPRYRVENFPNEEQILQLREVECPVIAERKM